MAIGVEFVIIWLHVDDGVVMASSEGMMQRFRAGMEKELKIKWKSQQDPHTGKTYH